MADALPPPPDDYDLKVDEQVENFVETKQKLTYFLISASIAVSAYLLNFVVEHRADIRFLLVLVIAGCLLGLTTAGACLLTLHIEHRTYQRHLAFRYKRKLWEDLSKGEQASWDRLNFWAGWMLRGAFVLLFLQITCTSLFFILFLIGEALCTTMAKTR